MFMRQIAAILMKDLKAEWRTREILTTMFVFTVLVIVVFNFALGANPELIRQVTPGILWVALLFATVLGLQRSAQMEYEDDCLSGVLLAMGERSAFFVAKTAGNMLYLLMITLCTFPLFTIWFRVNIFVHILPLSVVLLLGILGFSAIGTLFSIITLNTRTREIMLPLLFLPVSVPLMIASIYATAKLIAGKDLGEVTDFLTLMGVFDIVFLVVALLVFDAVVEE
jgi:heme exporter protein B